jgi:hypothetical protein
MARILKTAAIIIGVVIAAILIFAATRPGAFHVERSASIKASPEKIYPMIADFQAWGAWSPWEKKDPAMKRSFGGEPGAKGATYEWDGNSEVGKGRMTLADTAPPSKVVFNLDFEKPMEGHNVVTFTLEPQGEATAVKWAMDGDMNYVSKVITMFCNMDAMIGKEFESGLAAMKAEAEKM